MNVSSRLFVRGAGVILLGLTTLAMPMKSRAASPASPVVQKPQRFDATLRRSVGVTYLISYPQGYTAKSAERWPLLIFLHGAGERGTNLQAVTVHGPPKLVKNGRELPFVIVSPQCPPDVVWDVETLDAMLTKLLRTQAIDPRRVYLTGLSMGGYGTWAWAGAHPERFAAIAPICGGGEPIGVWLAGGARREALARLPIWVFHGAKDNVVPLAESERMVDAYKRLGNTARLTVYPEAGHDSWTASYDQPELYQWLLKQRLPEPSTRRRATAKPGS